MKIFFTLFLVLSSYSTLAYRVKEGQVILDKLEDYQKCQSDDRGGTYCHDALERWVDSHPDDVLKAALMTRRTMNSWAALPFYAKAFEQKKVTCADKDFQESLVSALALPMESSEEIVTQAQKIGLEACLPQIKERLNTEASVGSYAFKNVCKALVKAGVMKGLKAKKCAS